MPAKKAQDKKVVAKTPAQKKAETLRAKKASEKKAAKNAPQMISYSMKMVIPTGQYANIQPEIIVTAGTPEEAQAFIAPHMNKLWNEYFMISERKERVVNQPVTKPVVKPIVKPVVKPVVTPTPEIAINTAETPADLPHAETSPISDVALTKATQAIQSCLSTKALDLIIRQIGVSTKLTDEHKEGLLPVIEEKSKELNGEA